MRTVFLGCIVLLALACSPNAEAPSRLASCDTAATDEQQIINCTALVEAGNLTSDELAEVLHTRGFVHMRNERWDEALADFDSAVAADPTPQTASIYFNRGRVKATRGNHRAAIEDFTHATVINPRWSDPLSWRASSKEQMGDTAGALEDLDQAFARNPSELGRQAIARRRAEIAAETNPGRAD